MSRHSFWVYMDQCGGCLHSHNLLWAACISKNFFHCIGTITRFIPYKQILPNHLTCITMLRLMRVHVNGAAWRCTAVHSTIKSNIRRMHQVWCIIQWPPVGVFNRCCYHNFCAQKLFIWIHNEKVPHSRTQTVHTKALCIGTGCTEISNIYYLKLDYVKSWKQQRITVDIFHLASLTQMLPGGEA